MPYSLVSAATLGFDLVRLPAGRAVAGVLLTGLGADAGSPRPPRRGGPRPRARPARSAGSWPSGRAVPARWPPRSPTCAAPPSAGDRAAVLVAQLEQGTIGDAPTLERLLRDDVLGPEHPVAAQLPADERDEAAGVLADAAVGYWAAGVLPPLVRRELTGPYDRAVERGLVGVPAVGADLGPAAGELAGLLDAVRGLDEAGRAAWRTAVDEGARRAPALGHGHARGVLGGPRLRADPRPRDGAAARRPGLPRRRLRPARRRRRRVERPRRLRPGPGDGRPARRGVPGGPAGARAPRQRHLSRPHLPRRARERPRPTPSARAPHGLRATRVLSDPLRAATSANR